MSKGTGFILRSTKSDRTFEILKYDSETKQGTLIGEMGVEFKEDLSKERLKQYGYKVEAKPATEDDHAG